MVEKVLEGIARQEFQFEPIWQKSNLAGDQHPHFSGRAPTHKHHTLANPKKLCKTDFNTKMWPFLKLQITLGFCLLTLTLRKAGKGQNSLLLIFINLDLYSLHCIGEGTKCSFTEAHSSFLMWDTKVFTRTSSDNKYYTTMTILSTLSWIHRKSIRSVILRVAVSWNWHLPSTNPINRENKERESLCYIYTGTFSSLCPRKLSTLT